MVAANARWRVVVDGVGPDAGPRAGAAEEDVVVLVEVAVVEVAHEQAEHELGAVRAVDDGVDGLAVDRADLGADLDAADELAEQAVLAVAAGDEQDAGGRGRGDGAWGSVGAEAARPE